jgi:8-oxo-dGTP diphosphatase
MPVPDKMLVTADAVTLSYSCEEGLRLLLIRRANDPYEGWWALPGGFVDLEEDLLPACRRELGEETGLSGGAMVQVGAYGKPGRDPRGRNVTVAYLALVGPQQCVARAGDDAADAAWVDVRALPDLAFDHAEIIGDGLALLARLVRATHAACALLPERFTVEQLQGVLDASARIGRQPARAQDVLARGWFKEPAPGQYACAAADAFTELA